MRSRFAGGEGISPRFSMGLTTAEHGYGASGEWNNRRFASYLRASTSKQAAFGLGIEAQWMAVEDAL